MALTRKMLKAMGIEDEKIDQIIEAHSETIAALKEERDSYKDDASKLKDVQAKLDDANKTIEAGSKDAYKVKYEALKEEYENYKTEQADKETRATKTSAYKALLKEIGISEKRIEAVLKVSDIDSIELDKDGKLKNADKLKESIKAEWSDFIQSTSTQGARTSTPPDNNGGKSTKTKEEIMAIKDPVARQKAIVENPEAFGLKLDNGGH